MFLLRPLYCPNCKELVFLTNESEPRLLEATTSPWQKHGCQKLGDQPLFKSDILQRLLNLGPEEGFAFKHREGGYRGHGAPVQAVVLRPADERHPLIQMITADNGLFEVKFSDTEGLIQGRLVNLGKSRRTGNNKYRVDSWEAVDSLKLSDSSESDGAVYRLTLRSSEQEALEAHCTRLIRYFEKQGTPVVGITLLPIDGETYGRYVFISPRAKVLLGLEKTNLPSQLSYSIEQVDSLNLNEA